MSDTLFYGTSFGTVVGIILFTSQQNTYGLVAGVFICLMCILFIGKFSKKVFGLISTLVVSILLGYGVSYFRIPKLPVLYTNAINKNVTLSGSVISAESKNNIETVLVQPTGERFRVLLKMNSGHLLVGEHVQISGVLLYPENFTGSSDTVFDYVSYLKKDFVYVTLDKPQVQSVTPAGKWNIVARLAVWKNKIEDQINVS